jgi:glycosyltransferase involved in cell wall biosynthesis
MDLRREPRFSSAGNTLKPNQDNLDDTKLVSIVAPFFNEENMVERFYQTLIPILNGIQGTRFELVCINDGSRDNTLNALLALVERDSRVRVIDLSRNFGKEAALTAGIDEARGDAVIPIDADLQDPPRLIPLLIERWREGYDTVLAKRSDRRSDSFLKRRTAALFYRFHNTISEESALPENVGDFRLMDRVVVESLRRLPERRRFMKGLFAWVGFKTTTIEYTRDARAAGRTKFSAWKLWNFALEGITSFSTALLRFWTYLGFIIAIGAFAYAVFIVFRTLLLGVDVPGYASLLTAILFLGGIQLIGIGVLGEYIGRIYLEVKQRPVYLIRSRYSQQDNP